MLVKTGFLVAYDYDYLKISLPCVYDASDVIALAIDINRKTWAGNDFIIEQSFFYWLKEFDVKNKIRVYEDVFYQKNLTPMQMETAQRNKLASYLGSDGWHIQLDVDEYFIGFNQFAETLREIKSDSLTIYVKWKTIFKENENGYFFISENQRIPVATNNP